MLSQKTIFLPEKSFLSRLTSINDILETVFYVPGIPYLSAENLEVNAATVLSNSTLFLKVVIALLHKSCHVLQVKENIPIFHGDYGLIFSDPTVFVFILQLELSFVHRAMRFRQI